MNDLDLNVSTNNSTARSKLRRQRQQSGVLRMLPIPIKDNHLLVLQDLGFVSSYPANIKFIALAIAKLLDHLDKLPEDVFSLVVKAD